jgi:hypothetical protein
MEAFPVSVDAVGRSRSVRMKVKLCLEDGGCELVIKDDGVPMEEIKDQFEKVSRG